MLTDDDGHTVDRTRAPGANDMQLRLIDLDQEGVWAELVYPSIGIWTSSIHDPDLLAAGCRAINDWAIEFQRLSPRYVCTATIPLLTRRHAVAEIERAAELGLPRRVPLGRAARPTSDWNDATWEPVWAALAETGLVRRRSTSAPSRTTRARPRRATTAARAARCSTTWRPRTAASGRSPS